MLEEKSVSLLWADPDRAKKIADMHALLFEKAWKLDDMRALLAHPAAMSLVAKVRDAKTLDKPVNAGFVLAQLAADEAEIISIGVLEEFQGRGLGRIMMQGLIRAATIAEARRLFLEVAEDNRSADRLYKSLNFTEVGRRPGYYSRDGGGKVDAVVMARDLNIEPAVEDADEEINR
ncbi:MAG: GNAT family N-acetyltransferase [Hyphomicrobiaceae bacterium]